MTTAARVESRAQDCHERFIRSPLRHKGNSIAIMRRTIWHIKRPQRAVDVPFLYAVVKAVRPEGAVVDRHTCELVVSHESTRDGPYSINSCRVGFVSIQRATARDPTGFSSNP